MKLPFYKRMWFLVLVACFGCGFIASRFVTYQDNDAFVPIYMSSLILSIILAICFANYFKRKASDRHRGIQERLYAMHVHGLPIGIGKRVAVLLVEDALIFEGKGLVAQIKLEDIQTATAMKYNNWATEQTDAIIRGHSGSVLTGNYEQFSARISGAGGRVMKKGNYLVINYISSTGQLSSVVFNGLGLVSTNNFVRSINKPLPAPPSGIIQL
ncbi:hypothetical protein H8B09_27915 [Paenibacillus sp. PR3]|uniref:Uncharacterized protein n=1 Tax=Paenibacillus terricola TaxID=2763503 RepID=A0ABR8N3Z4_9BACL|nr:hypothetical protein [Paenibacillus terricola]MBD3922585.1 hypothetical protein [Paenibacillus terricola]